VAVREVDRSDKRELMRFIRMERELIGDHLQDAGEQLDADVRTTLEGDGSSAG
jgi:hypothetical protein